MPHLKYLVLKELVNDKQIVVLKADYLFKDKEAILTYHAYTDTFICGDFKFRVAQVKSICIGHYAYEITLS